jgi:hypothetical protein
MRWTRPLFLLALFFLFTLPARADWDASQPYKWLQNPDLTPLGVDVQASYDFNLADDFQCTSPGLITGIHIWGSWYRDVLPGDLDPGAVTFTLSIHRDIPASPLGLPYSTPGELLWERVFQPGSFAVRPWEQGLEEGWVVPPDGYEFPGDTICWEYNFKIPEDEAFVQQGTSSEPIVYWLHVNAVPADGAARFGWKSSVDHWNDDATWGQGKQPFGGPWVELVYPPAHELSGRSIDLAFVLQGTDLPPELDFGDAPDQNYRTLLASNGANHVITPNLLLGATVDPEPDGQPSLDALGDDIDLFYPSAGDDEDGVVFTTPLIPGQPASVDVQDIGGGLLNGFIDFDGNGDWGGPGEQIFVDKALNPGLNTLPFAVPATAIVGPTFARFRLSSLAGLSFDGAAPDGEVEDYQVAIEEPQTFKWIQNPDLEYTGIDVNAQEPFILADDFLCTQTGYLSQIRVWGSWRGDQFPGSAIPDNVQFVLSLHADVPAVAGQSPSHPGEVLWVKNFPPGTFQTALYADQIEEGWMDPPEDYAFPGDHQCWEYIFDIPVDEAFIQLGIEPAPIVYWLDVQAIPLDANAVFGWKTSLDHWNDDAVWGTGAEPYAGPWKELFYPPAHQFAGQSIDLAFSLNNAPDPVKMDFGDVPDTYRTFLASDGARHVIVPGFQLGHVIDAEADGQPNAAATGDDLGGVDDEDGVTFVSPLGVGQVTHAKVIASANGILNVWLDVDQNGTWTELYDHIVVDLPINAGGNLVPIATPAFAQTGKTFMRFRYSRQPGLSYFGPARIGEVEDYLVAVFTPTGNTSVPRPLHLDQNVPNPFNPNTVVSFYLPSKMAVTLAVYDLHGKLVRTLVDGEVDAGHHPVSWDGRSNEGRAVASGIYVARLNAGSVVQTVKMTLLR